MRNLSLVHKGRPDLILAAWPQVIGPKLAGMTEALRFQEGVLTIAVKNSTLHSLLSRQEKKRLMQALKDRFPQAGIRDLQFRIG